MAPSSTATEDFLSEKQVGEGGMKGGVVWVRDENFSGAKGSAAERKKAERKLKEETKNEKQVNVVTINDKRAVATLRAVAEAIKDPNALAVISAVAGDDRWLRWLIAAVSIERFRAIKGISPEDAERLWHRVRSVIEAAINNDQVADLVHESFSNIDRVDLARRVISSGAELRAAIAAMVANDPWLVELTAELAQSNGRDQRIERAVTGAIREPKLVVAMTSAIQAGGFRGWILKRILGA